MKSKRKKKNQQNQIITKHYWKSSAPSGQRSVKQ